MEVFFYPAHGRFSIGISPAGTPSRAAPPCEGHDRQHGRNVASAPRGGLRRLPEDHFVLDVHHAASVRAALELARSQAFDVVISDIGLPDGNGAELMQRLTTEHRLRGIAMSGYGMEEDIRRSLHAGFHAHLTKPVSVDLLEAAIGEVATFTRSA